MEERLQKIMAQSGIGSRRDCEVLIITGRVYVNGIVAIIGQKADSKKDKIMVDGKLIRPPQQKMYYALHKPRMVLSAVDSEPGDTRKTVRDLLPVGERLYPVGRLDFDSEGLVLMTNDGDLAQKLTHPSHEHEKEYRVLVASQPDDDQLGKWRRGVVMEDGYKTLPAEVRIEGAAGKGCWLRIVMKEGKKRQIREIGSLIGLPVVRIVRIRIGTLLLGQLKPGEWRVLSSNEIAALKGDAAVPIHVRPLNRSGRKYPPRRPQGEGHGGPSHRPQGDSRGGPSRRPQSDVQDAPWRPQSDAQGGPSRRAQGEGHGGPSRRPQSDAKGGPSRRAQGEGHGGPSRRPQNGPLGDTDKKQDGRSSQRKTRPTSDRSKR